MFKSVFILLILCLSFCVQADTLDDEGQSAKMYIPSGTDVKIIYEKPYEKNQAFLLEIKEEFRQLKNNENKFKQALIDHLKSAAANAFALAKIKENTPDAETYYKQAIQLDPEATKATKVDIEEAKQPDENQKFSLKAKKVVTQSESNEKQLIQALANNLKKAADDASALAKIKDLQSNSSEAKNYHQQAIMLDNERKKLERLQSAGDVNNTKVDKNKGN